MHTKLTHLVAVLDSSKEPHELVVKSVAVSRLSYAQERARDFRSQHTDINHLVVIAEIVQFQRRSEDIYITDPRELGIAKSNDALESITVRACEDGCIGWGGGACPVSGAVRVWYACANGSYGFATAEELRWEHLGGGSDIIKYRVVKP